MKKIVLAVFIAIAMTCTSYAEKHAIMDRKDKGGYEISEFIKLVFGEIPKYKERSSDVLNYSIRIFNKHLSKAGKPMVHSKEELKSLLLKYCSIKKVKVGEFQNSLWNDETRKVEFFNEVAGYEGECCVYDDGDITFVFYKYKCANIMDDTPNTYNKPQAKVEDTPPPALVQTAPTTTVVNNYNTTVNNYYNNESTSQPIANNSHAQRTGVDFIPDQSYQPIGNSGYWYLGPQNFYQGYGMPTKVQHQRSHNNNYYNNNNNYSSSNNASGSNPQQSNNASGSNPQTSSNYTTGSTPRSW